MKKILAFIIAIIMVCSIASAMAEDFTIHAGTKFGDTIDEVKEKETLRFFEKSVDFYNSKYSELVFHGEVAGFEDASIYYYLNTKSKVFDVRYEMMNTYSVTNAEYNKGYRKLYQMLKDKYGTPLDKDSKVYILFQGHYASNVIKESKKNPRGGSITDLVSWTAPYDKYIVKIDLYTRELFNGSKLCNIEYYKYTKKELKKRTEEYENTLKKQSDDL